ncbi:InlB B-repeat-containing protein [Niabella soli]|nr:InlB B-repeat-containing protein [Niabella soli]
MKQFFDHQRKQAIRRPVVGVVLSGIIILSCIGIFSSCSKSDTAVDRTCTVTFILNQTNAAGDTVIVEATAGALVKDPPVPVRAGFTFKGWYTNAADANPDPAKNTAAPKFPEYDIATKPIYLDAILYARWVK